MRRYQEALQRAAQHGALTPEQMQMIQAAFQQMEHAGGIQQGYVVMQQGGQATAYPQGGPDMKAPPTTYLPNQAPNPSAIPQGYVDPMYQNALADLQRWLGQYEKYRMQGSFAQLEPIFQTIKQITGR